MFPEDARCFAHGEVVHFDDEDGEPVCRYRVVGVDRDVRSPLVVTVTLEQIAAGDEDREPS